MDSYHNDRLLGIVKSNEEVYLDWKQLIQELQPPKPVESSYSRDKELEEIRKATELSLRSQPKTKLTESQELKQVSSHFQLDLM